MVVVCVGSHHIGRFNSNVYVDPGSLSQTHKQDTHHHRVIKLEKLFLVIKTLACSTKYRVPWGEDFGLPRIALFLGRRFSQKHNYFGMIPMNCGSINSDFCQRFSLPHGKWSGKLIQATNSSSDFVVFRFGLDGIVTRAIGSIDFGLGFFHHSMMCSPAVYSVFEW